MCSGKVIISLPFWHAFRRNELKMSNQTGARIQRHTHCTVTSNSVEEKVVSSFRSQPRGLSTCSRRGSVREKVFCAKFPQRMKRNENFYMNETKNLLCLMVVSYDGEAIKWNSKPNSPWDGTLQSSLLEWDATKLNRAFPAC